MKKGIVWYVVCLMVVGMGLYACGGGGGNSSVPTSTTAPAAPTGVSATAGDGQATIVWTAVSGATSYNIYWSTTANVTPANGTKISGMVSPYTSMGLNNGTTYYAVVTAVNANGESPASSQVSATPTILAAANGEIYIANANNILIHERTASGNVAPVRTISGALTGLSTAHGIFVDTVNNEIFIANSDNDSITVYSKTASGNVAPLRTIMGASTVLSAPIALAVDTVNNEIIVANANNGSVLYPHISVYARTANGNAAPLRMFGSFVFKLKS